MANPFFSIILPTYNREAILPLAIRSILEQTFQDFELVVNNSASTDNTRAVCQSFSDDRLKYFETETRLGMAENYETALGHATGEFIVFFSDDDALIPTALEKVEQVIRHNDAQMVVFPFAKYFHDTDDQGQNRANTLEIPEYSSKVYVRDAKQDIDLMRARFGLADRSSIDAESRGTEPLIGNVVYRRELSDRLKESVGSLFATVPVDIYFITLLLSVIDKYHVLDEPLLVWSQWAKNSSVFLKADLRAHYERLLNGKTLDEVPLKFALPANCSANALLAAMRAMDADQRDRVDWGSYFSLMYETIVYLDAEGVDVGSERAEFEKVLAEQTLELQAAVANRRNSGLLFRQRLKKSVPGLFSFARRLARAGRPQTSVGKLVDGRYAGFADLLESANYLSTLEGVNKS
jgi:glycosyltransferase involved in cell wall biosynthesis